MNLTILSLHLSAISIIPTFTQINHLELKFSSFSHFASPLIYNTYGQFSHNKFTHALSSIVLTEKVDLVDITCDASNKDKEQIWNDTVMDSVVLQDKALMSFDTCDSVSISHITFRLCHSNVETGLISVKNAKDLIVTNGCFASCHSKGATCLYAQSEKADISLITTIDCTSYYAESTITTVNSNFDADYINVTNSNLLMSASFSCYESTGFITYLLIENAFNVNGIMIHNCPSIGFEFAQVLGAIFNENVLQISSPFTFNHSICVGYKCNEFIGYITDEISGSPDSISFLFYETAFDQPLKSVSDKEKNFVQCTFELKYTYTITAFFLNTKYCVGYTRPITEEFNPSSSIEMTGLIVVITALVLVVLYIIRACLYLKGKIKVEEEEVSVSEDSFSDMDESDDQIRFRKGKRRSTFDEQDIESMQEKSRSVSTPKTKTKTASTSRKNAIIKVKSESEPSEDRSYYSHHSSSDLSSPSVSDTIPRISKMIKSPKYHQESDDSSSLSVGQYISSKRASNHQRNDDSSSSTESVKPRRRKNTKY